MKKILKIFLYNFFIIFFIYLFIFSTKNVYANTYKIENIEISDEYNTNFNKEYRHATFENSHLYVHDQLNELVDGYSFFVGGSNNSQFKRTTDTKTLKIDYTNQINSFNMIKLGLEFRSHSVFFQDIYLQPPTNMTNIDPIYESPYLISPQILPNFLYLPRDNKLVVRQTRLIDFYQTIG